LEWRGSVGSGLAAIDVSGKRRGPALCGHDGNRLGQEFGVGVAVLNRFMVWGEVPVRRRDDWEVEGNDDGVWNGDDGAKRVIMTLTEW